MLQCDVPARTLVQEQVSGGVYSLMSGKRFFGTLFDSARDPGSIAVRTRYTFGVREHIEQLSVVIAGACCPALYWFVPV